MLWAGLIDEGLGSAAGEGDSIAELMPLDYRLTGPDAPGSSSRCQSGGGGYGARQKALHDFLHICTHIESTAKLFKNKRAKAARLSKAYKLKGDEVKIRTKVDKVILDSLENTE